MHSIEELAHIASSTLVKNTDCFMAQWILQNPNEPIERWVLCVQNSWATGMVEYSMRVKDGHA